MRYKCVLYARNGAVKMLITVQQVFSNSRDITIWLAYLSDRLINIDAMGIVNESESLSV